MAADMLAVASCTSLALCACSAVAICLRQRALLRRASERLVMAISANGGDGHVQVGATGIEDDIDRLCLHLKSLQHRALRRHPVTGLETRDVLLSKIAAATKDPLALGVVSLADFDALAAFDIDAADQVLNILAQRLIRMMPANRLLAQIDRGAFAILFEPEVGEKLARELDALAYALKGHIQVSGVEYLPQIAFGHVLVEAPVERAAAVLSRLLASVRAENSIGGPGDYAARAESFALEQDLRQAIDRHQFELHYQPVVDARTAEMCSVEALIRWRHPQRGFVSPNEFIPIMERMGLSDEIGRWVLDRAARDAAAWSRAGLGHVKVAVNLSAHQLARADLDEVIERIIGRHGLAPARLELELTETAAAVDPVAARALFARLRARGITIVIDDFGAGYASLSYLKKLSFDKLKIDREFVTNVDTDKHAQAICLSIIALARGLDLTVLAEGIERPEEYAWLRRHGCNLFQGYYFAKPLDYEALLSFAATRPACNAEAIPTDAPLSLRWRALAA